MPRRGGEDPGRRRDQTEGRRRDQARPLTLDVIPGRPHRAWHAAPQAPAPATITVVEQVSPGTGEVSSGTGDGGRLIRARDNLDALHALADAGVLADLVYLDPPYMAGSDRVLAAPGDPLAYRDTWPGGLDAYLDMLRARLAVIRGLLARTGNLVVHLDWHAVHYAKVLLDELFGAGNFRNEIVWRRANAHSDPARFGVITDSLLLYGAGPQAFWADVHVPYAPEYIASHWRKRDERGPYRLVPLDAPRHGDGGRLVYAWRGKLPAPTRTWAVVRETMEALEREGRIAYTSAGTPNIKRYLDESPGLRAQNLWDDIPPVNPMAAERLGYPTQKPVALLERVIAATCPEGGLVLDPFLGSGTTAEAAERLGRRWIGVDRNPDAIRMARDRLVALHGQPGRGPASVRYETCEACRRVTRRDRARRGPALQVRPFTVEACE